MHTQSYLYFVTNEKYFSLSTIGLVLEEMF